MTCAGGGTRPLDPSQTFDCAAEPAAVADTHVATQAEGKLESIKRVAITNFCVQFVYSKEARGDSAGYWVEYSRTASGAIPGGLDPGRTRAMADAFLDRIEADLMAAGIEIVPYEELAANDLYQKFTAKYDTGVRIGEHRLEGGKGRSAGAESVRRR